MSSSKAFKVTRAEMLPGAIGAEVATIRPGELFYPRADGETFDWPGGESWFASAMADGELVALRVKLAHALTVVEDVMAERNMFRRYT